jgi:hypothetical protein
MFPIQISQGGTGATNAADARTNLDVPQTADVVPVTRLINSGDALNGGGALSSDLTLDVQVGLGLEIPGGVEIALDLTDSHNVNHDNVDLLAGTGISASGLGNISADRTINANLATESLEGVRQIATQGEADAGLLDTVFMTPLKVANLPGGASDYVVTSGSFVPVWSGFSSDPTLTVFFTRLTTAVIGASDIAILRFAPPGSPTGTSNATNMSITNLPGAITPDGAIGGSIAHLIGTVIDNGSLNLIARADAGFTGTLTFSIGRDNGIAGTAFGLSPTLFTAAGVKGISQQTLIMYLLN